MTNESQKGSSVSRSRLTPSRVPLMLDSTSGEQRSEVHLRSVYTSRQTFFTLVLLDHISLAQLLAVVMNIMSWLSILFCPTPIPAEMPQLFASPLGITSTYILTVPTIELPFMCANKYIEYWFPVSTDLNQQVPWSLPRARIFEFNQKVWQVVFMPAVGSKLSPFYTPGTIRTWYIKFCLSLKPAAQVIAIATQPPGILVDKNYPFIQERIKSLFSQRLIFILPITVLAQKSLLSFLQYTPKVRLGELQQSRKRNEFDPG